MKVPNLAKENCIQRVTFNIYVSGCLLPRQALVYVYCVYCYVSTLRLLLRQYVSFTATSVRFVYCYVSTLRLQLRQ